MFGHSPTPATEGLSDRLVYDFAVLGNAVIDGIAHVDEKLIKQFNLKKGDSNTVSSAAMPVHSIWDKDTGTALASHRHSSSFSSLFRCIVYLVLAFVSPSPPHRSVIALPVHFISVQFISARNFHFRLSTLLSSERYSVSRSDHRTFTLHCWLNTLFTSPSSHHDIDSVHHCPARLQLGLALMLFPPVSLCISS